MQHQLDVSAVATQVVKDFEFSFVIQMKLKESMGSQEARFVITIHILGLKKKRMKGNTSNKSASQNS